MNSRFKKLIVFVAVICSSFIWFGVYTDSPIGGERAQAASVNQGITVNVTVPVPDVVGGGSSDQVPSIFSVASVVSFTTATVSWSASDDHGITASGFVYGLTVAYGSSGVITGAYTTELSGLAVNTQYFFKISVTDTVGHLVDYTGTFTTLLVPPDTTPPSISGVLVFAGITTSSIKWDTNESSDSQINYGLTNAYGSNYFDSSGVLAHSVLLFNLTPNTLYHFQIISTDSSGNSANTADSTFTTGADIVPPPDVSGFILTTTSDSIVLSWTNPSLAGTPDFSLVKVARKIGSASVGPGDGTIVYTGNGENFTDFNVIVNTDYFYTIFSFDTSNNHSPGIFRNGKILPAPVPPPVEICGNNIDDDNNGKTDCADSVCSSLPECIVVPPTSTPAVPEICNNGNDDDLNGKIDCADNACSGYSSCVSVPLTIACNNGLDDDNDGKIDFPNDPGCENLNDNDEYDPPEPSVPSFQKINLTDLEFLAGNRQIKLDSIDEKVTGLSGANLTIAIPKNILASNPSSMILRVGDTDQHLFVFNATDQMYYADISFKGIGITQSYVEIDYGSGQFDSIGFKLNSLPWGQVVDEKNKALAGVEATLLRADGTIMPMGNYGQVNPVIVGANGDYGWMAPNGDYKVDLYKDGYYDRSINNNVNNHVINSKISLIARPPKLELKIDPDASLQDNAINVAKALGEQTKVFTEITIQKIQDVASNPEVQKANERVVAPTAITVVVAGAASFISWMDFLPFMRLLFLQPLMLLGLRKREKWGLVYNSLNKMPVDLAMVRLISLETNRVVQSKVTDAKGHFIFMVNPGKYKLEVQKNGFVYPSNLLAGSKSDGQKVDIYHGEIVEVLKSSSIATSIPLDPTGVVKKPFRLVLEKFGRRLQFVLSLTGILVTVASLYISPKWYIYVLLVVHVSTFFIFRRLAVPPKTKNWGIIYDESNKAPISRVIARLFNAQFNKLVDTQISDASGKYYFMAGDAKYYVTYEHKAYHPQKTDIIDLEGKDAEVITLDVKLKKN